MRLVNLVHHSLDRAPNDLVIFSQEGVEATIVTSIVDGDISCRVRTPSISSTSTWSPKVSDSGNVLRRPSGEVTKILGLGPIVLVSEGPVGSILWISIRVVLGRDIVGRS